MVLAALFALAFGARSLEVERATNVRVLRAGAIARQAVFTSNGRAFRLARASREAAPASQRPPEPDPGFAAGASNARATERALRRPGGARPKRARGEPGPASQDFGF